MQTLPSTVFLFVSTHGSIPLKYNETTDNYSYKKVELPSDLTLYRVNSAAPGVCNASYTMKKEHSIAIKALIETIQSVNKNEEEFYDSLKDFSDEEIEIFIELFSDNMKEYFKKIKLNRLFKEKKKGEPFDNPLDKNVYEKGAKIYNYQKIKQEGEQPGITYEKEYAYNKKNADDSWNLILALNGYDEKVEDNFELFKYTGKEEPIFLSEMIDILYGLGARKIVLLDLSCFVFLDERETAPPAIFNEDMLNEEASVATEAVEEIIPMQRKYRIPERNERWLRNLLEKKLKGIEDKNGDLIGGSNKINNKKRKTRKNNKKKNKKKNNKKKNNTKKKLT